jgi:hypothetical protein
MEVTDTSTWTEQLAAAIALRFIEARLTVSDLRACLIIQLV